LIVGKYSPHPRIPATLQVNNMAGTIPNIVPNPGSLVQDNSQSWCQLGYEPLLKDVENRGDVAE
jgi:hypothetical protein